MDDLQDLLKNPSVESWKAIVKLGRRHSGKPSWPQFEAAVLAAVPSWPKEVARTWPEGVGPPEFKTQVENRIRETDTYGHYLQRICGDSRLQIDGKQRVWLERRFTGGVVPASSAKQVISTLLEASKSNNWKLIGEAIQVLAGSIRNTGKVGTADLTGGLMLRLARDGISLTQECPSKQGVATNTRVNSQNATESQEKTLEVRLEIEIKVGGGTQRPEQIARERSVRSRGGCYILCRSVEEAVTQIVRFINENEYK